MEQKNGNTIFLSVIGIATLLVAIIGATFAYFTTTMTGSAGTATVQTAKVSNITMTSVSKSVENVLPGAIVPDMEVKVEFADKNSVTEGFSATYTCTVKKSGTVTDLQYRKHKDAATSDTDTWTDLTTDGTWTSTLNSTTPSETWYVGVRFKETGANQNTQSGQTGVVTVDCGLADSTIYYTTGAESGTTNEPTAY